MNLRPARLRQQCLGQPRFYSTKSRPSAPTLAGITARPPKLGYYVALRHSADTPIRRPKRSFFYSTGFSVRRHQRRHEMFGRLMSISRLNIINNRWTRNAVLEERLNLFITSHGIIQILSVIIQETLERILPIVSIS